MASQERNPGARCLLRQGSGTAGGRPRHLRRPRSFEAPPGREGKEGTYGWPPPAAPRGPGQRPRRAPSSPAASPAGPGSRELGLCRPVEATNLSSRPQRPSPQLARSGAGCDLFLLAPLVFSFNSSLRPLPAASAEPRPRPERGHPRQQPPPPPRAGPGRVGRGCPAPRKNRSRRQPGACRTSGRAPQPPGRAPQRTVTRHGRSPSRGTCSERPGGLGRGARGDPLGPRPPPKPRGPGTARAQLREAGRGGGRPRCPLSCLAGCSQAGI